MRAPPAGEPGPPKELPDTLRGEAWQFVQLPLADLQSELQQAMQVINLHGSKQSASQHTLAPAVWACSCTLANILC